MTFLPPGLGKIQGRIYTGEDYSTLEFFAREIRFIFDSADMQEDVQQLWAEEGSDGGDAAAFLHSYLADRFAIRADFVISDSTVSSSPGVTIPMTYFHPVSEGRRGPFGRRQFRWVESNLLPFSRIFRQSFNEFDPFELGSDWLLYSGDYQSVETETLDVNPPDYFPPFRPIMVVPDSGIETVRLDLRIVDLHQDEQVAATFTTEWEHDFARARVGTREQFRA